jgi:hypothetical protein
VTSAAAAIVGKTETMDIKKLIDATNPRIIRGRRYLRRANNEVLIQIK